VQTWEKREGALPVWCHWRKKVDLMDLNAVWRNREGSQTKAEFRRESREKGKERHIDRRSGRQTYEVNDDRDPYNLYKTRSIVLLMNRVTNTSTSTFFYSSTLPVLLSPFRSKNDPPAGGARLMKAQNFSSSSAWPHWCCQFARCYVKWSHTLSGRANMFSSLFPLCSKITSIHSQRSYTQ
jgi:hypothetical protein